MQHFLLFSFVAIAATLGCLAVIFRQDLAMSFSLNAAKHTYARWGFAGGVIVGLVLAGLWYAGWFMPTVMPSLWSNLLLTTIIMSLFIAALVPDVKGRRRIIHRSFAYVGVVLGPLFLLTLLSGVGSQITPVFIVVIIVQVVIAALAFSRVAQPYYMYLQAAYLLSFYGALLWLTYAR